jgi:predicted Zn-dependent protease with MMP-like domain
LIHQLGGLWRRDAATRQEAAEDRKRHRDRGGEYHAPIHCVEHAVDLAALRHYVDDGKPVGEQATLDSIQQAECPACRPRYVAGWEPASAERPADLVDRLFCPCCRTTWERTSSRWLATVGGSLQITGEESPIPAGMTIDSSWFVVEAIDPIAGPEQALRGEFNAFNESRLHPALDDLVDDVTEAVLAVYSGKADQYAELTRIKDEHGLGDSDAESLQSVAFAALSVLQNLLISRSPVQSRCSHPGPGVEVSRERFEELVAQGLDSIPGELGSLMENVAVVVEDEAANMPNSAHLFGLYQGVPLTARRRYGGAAPDRIAIYQRPISRHCRTEAEIADQVRRTVIHEVGHHFGINDARLRELGW